METVTGHTLVITYPFKELSEFITFWSNTGTRYLFLYNIQEKYDKHYFDQKTIRGAKLYAHIVLTK